MDLYQGDSLLSTNTLTLKPRFKKSLLIAFVLLFFTLSWWTMSLLAYRKLYTSVESSDAAASFGARMLYFISIVVSSLFGSIIARRIKTVSFLYYWMIAGVVSSLVPIFLANINQLQLLAVSILLGSTFGIGMPSCLALFAELASLEVRGSVSGAIFLASNLAIAALAVVLQNVELIPVSLIEAVWRAIGLVLFILLKPRLTIQVEARRQVSFGSVLQNRQFLLYFIPWLAFSLIEWLEAPIRASLFKEFALEADIIGISLGSVSAIIGGVFSDRIGRKIIVLYGFVSIGIAYAILTIAPTTVLIQFFYMTVDAIAWGLFYTFFVLVLWGDLSQSTDREKYYAIGNIPFFLAGMMELVVNPYAVLINPTMAFSFAAFFLFLAVLPLLYAPETLPEKRIRERELKQYLEEAKKIKEKHV
jgi:MFS family permease